MRKIRFPIYQYLARILDFHKDFLVFISFVAAWPLHFSEPHAKVSVIPPVENGHRVTHFLCLANHVNYGLADGWADG